VDEAVTRVVSDGDSIFAIWEVDSQHVSTLVLLNFAEGPSYTRH
jgi:hypothetical protein